MQQLDWEFNKKLISKGNILYDSPYITLGKSELVDCIKVNILVVILCYNCKMLPWRVTGQCVQGILLYYFLQLQVNLQLSQIGSYFVLIIIYLLHKLFVGIKYYIKVKETK